MADTPSTGDSMQASLPQDFKNVPSQALDALRMRLSQLIASLAKIRDEMSRAELPQWYTLQAQLTVTLTQLSSLTNTLHHYEEGLDAVVAYPLPSFPTTAHEGLITTLMRKKNIPEVDEWIRNARETSGIDVESVSDNQLKSAVQKNKEITAWATQCLIKERKNHSFTGLHTMRELNEDGIDAKANLYSSSISKVKTSKPFDTDSVLKFIHQGEFNE